MKICLTTSEITVDKSAFALIIYFYCIYYYDIDFVIAHAFLIINKYVHQTFYIVVATSGSIC